MIKNIVFDFGDVFINLDKDATYQSLNQMGIHQLSDEMIQINEQYEIGKINSKQFISFYKNLIPKESNEKLIEAWNAIILDFPEYRLEFIEKLATSKKYQLILLSNTNVYHIEKVIENMTLNRYQRFKSCFDSFYLSQEIKLRKPTKEIYQFVLDQHQIQAKECLFIDDTLENTNTAKKLGFHTWNINSKTEDVVNLFTIKNELF